VVEGLYVKVSASEFYNSKKEGKDKEEETFN
jgi:hypothetical protein